MSLKRTSPKLKIMAAVYLSITSIIKSNLRAKMSLRSYFRFRYLICDRYYNFGPRLSNVLEKLNRPEEHICACLCPLYLRNAFTKYFQVSNPMSMEYEKWKWLRENLKVVMAHKTRDSIRIILEGESEINRRYRLEISHILSTNMFPSFFSNVIVLEFAIFIFF